MRAPRPFKSARQTRATKAMKHRTHTPRFAAACALLIMTAVAPRGSSAAVRVTTEWIANTSESLAMALQPDVLQTRLRSNMGSVYVAASLPADSLVDAVVDAPVEHAYATPPPPTTAKPPSPPPPPPTPPTPLTTTAAGSQNQQQQTSTDVGMSGNAAVLAASLAVGGVGLIGVAVWALARKQPSQPCNNPCAPTVIPEKIVRPQPSAPPYVPAVAPPPQPYVPAVAPPPPYVPAMPYNPTPPQLVPQPVTITPQVVYYTQAPPPTQPQMQPVIPVNIDRPEPAYRVYTRS
jgi:hypothetical protein